MKRYWLILLACLCFVIISGIYFHSPELDSQKLRILTPKAEVIYLVETAQTPAQQKKGLMYRKSLPADQGMLFDFHQKRLVGMWMKNTYIPLDMLFVDENGIIRHIHQNARPLDETIITSKVPVQYVIELNAGQVKENQIQIGNKVRGIK